MNTEDAMQRRELWYRGQVQGVGFRYTVARLAEGRPVTGFVRNLPDGRVHLVAEGQPEDLDAFLEAVGQRMGELIRDTEQNEGPATGEFDDFKIRF